MTQKAESRSRGGAFPRLRLPAEAPEPRQSAYFFSSLPSPTIFRGVWISSMMP